MDHVRRKHKKGHTAASAVPIKNPEDDPSESAAYEALDENGREGVLSPGAEQPLKRRRMLDDLQDEGAKQNVFCLEQELIQANARIVELTRQLRGVTAQLTEAGRKTEMLEAQYQQAQRYQQSLLDIISQSIAGGRNK